MGDDGPGRVPPGEPLAGVIGLGDRPDPVEAGRNWAVIRELTALWLVSLLLIRLVVAGHEMLGLHEAVLAAVPLLFIYAPVALCRWRKVDSWDYRLSIPAFRDKAAWKQAVLINARVVAIISVPWLVGYHLYQTHLFGLGPGHGWPDEVGTLIAYQLFFVAIPEEFFYRGYFQTRLNQVYPRKFLILGVPMGWGAVLAALFFAFGHSIVHLQWWHFATFFPGMAFAWMRERTGGVITGAIFHALCNVTVVFLDTHYGIL